MATNLRYLGLDVHAGTIAAAVAEPDGEIHPLGIVANRPEAVAKLIRNSAAWSRAVRRLSASSHCPRCIPRL